MKTLAVPDDTVRRVSEVVAETSGLRTSAATLARLSSGVRRRVDARGIDADQYPTLLAGDATERQALLELLTVQETSWFRDPDQLDAVVRLLRGERRGPAVVWCAGTATGQEAWSVAMALDEAGMTEWQVVATDASARAVERARAGCYSEHELRGLSSARRARYLRRTASGHDVVASLRDRVRVVHHNVAVDAPPFPLETCAAVLCRNVFIYMTAGGVEAAVSHIHDALAPGGHLVVGVSETLRHGTDRLQLVRLGEMFAYKRSGSPAAAGGPARRAWAATMAADPAHSPPRAANDAAARAGAGPDLPTAADLRRTGERAVREGDLSAAVQSFRAAAYLDADDALAHLGLALALEADGQASAARRALRACRGAIERAGLARLEADLDGWSAEAVIALLDTKLVNHPSPPNPSSTGVPQ